MNYWKRLRWIASIVFVVVLLISLAAAILHRSLLEDADLDEAAAEQRVLPPVPVHGRGQPSHNSTGL